MSSKYGGYMGKVLKIDLTTREVSEYPWTDQDREMYLGGKIMAARILYDTVKPGIDPLGPDNVLVVSTGPLTGTGAPSSSRFNVSALSPLTGAIASSNCGGTFGLNLKRAGYDAVVITGRAESPTRIEITENDVKFHDASDLWGMTTGETQANLPPKIGHLVIGPAGEHRVLYAGIFSGERTAGRAGMGAVMGAKNIKAITAAGTKKAEPHSVEKMKKVYKAWFKLLQNHPLTGRELPAYGSAFLLRRMQKRRVLATRNFSAGQYADYDKISGHTLAEKYLVTNTGCVTCPVKCSRQVEVHGKKVKGPELETLALLGSNIENNDLPLILRWNYELDELGMDTISLAGTIAFAMELNERGLWDNGLRFGQVENLSTLFEDIAHRRGIGDLLADGTKRLAERFGGAEFAINSKGLELAAYEPRGAVGQGLGYATSNRGGCHLNAGYLVFIEGLGLGVDSLTPRAKASLTILQQNLMEAISAAGNCFFPLFSSTPAFLVDHPDHIITRFVNAVVPYSGWMVNLIINMRNLPIHVPGLPYTNALSAVTGMKIRFGEFKAIGERGYNLERMFNVRQGFTEKEDALPKRLTDELQIPSNPKSHVPLAQMKKEYYRIRDWDAQGIPTERKRRKLLLV